MAQELPFAPPLVLHFGEVPKTFHTVSELEAWAQNELAVWGELRKCDNFGAFYQSARKQQHAPFDQLLKLVEQAHASQRAGQQTSEEAAAHLEKEIGKLQKYFGPNKSVVSDSPFGQFVLAQKTTGVPSALLGLARGISIDNTTTQWLPILIAHRLLIERDHDLVGGTTDSELEKLVRSYAERFKEQETQRRQADDEYTRQRAAFAEFQSESQKQFADQLAKYEERFSGLEKRYHEQLTVSAPVSYWSKKAASHRTGFMGWSLAFVILMSGALLVLACYGLPQLVEFAKTVTKEDWHGLSVVAVASVGFPTFAVIWLLRLVSRMIVTNSALMYDARERVAMTQTYLALTEHTKDMKDADRLLILQALFRPSVTSTPDDSPPPNWFDALMGRIGGKSG